MSIDHGLTVYSAPMRLKLRNMVIVGDVRNVLPVLDERMNTLSDSGKRYDDLRRMASREHEHERWYGLQRCESAHDVIKAIRAGLESGVWDRAIWGSWIDGLADADAKLAKALASVEIPRVPIFRRQRHWNDESGDPDADVVVVGGQRGWRETRKDRKVRGSGKLTLLIDVCSSSGTPADSWRMQSAAVRWTVQHLHKLGYRVSVVLLTRTLDTQSGAHGSIDDTQAGLSRVYVPAPMLAAGRRQRFAWDMKERRYRATESKHENAWITALVALDGSRYDPELVDALGCLVSPAMFRGPMFTAWTMAGTGQMSYGLGHVSQHLSLAPLVACHGDILPRPFAFMSRAHDGAEAVAGIVSALLTVSGQGDEPDASVDRIEIQPPEGGAWEVTY